MTLSSPIFKIFVIFGLHVAIIRGYLIFMDIGGNASYKIYNTGILRFDNIFGMLLLWLLHHIVSFLEVSSLRRYKLSTNAARLFTAVTTKLYAEIDQCKIAAGEDLVYNDLFT